MEKIRDVLKRKFTFSVEMVPPRNGSSVDIFEKLKELKEMNIDFLSVTKGAGGSLRGGTLPISYFAQNQFGINTIAHFTCRETVKERIENDLMDLDYFKIRNILALRGDPPDMAENYEWNEGYKYAYQLVQQIKKMNEGKYLARKGFDDEKLGHRPGKKTDFCIGVAAHPEEPSGNRVEYLKKKAEEGAEYAITQMVFDADIYKGFLEELKKAKVNIPVIAGVWPLDAKWKLKQTEEKFKATVPKETRDKLTRIDDEREFRKKGIEATIDLCRKLKKSGAAGIHLFIFVDTESAREIFDALRL